MKRILVICSLVFLSNSCDCIQEAQGIVIDRKTKQPIQGVSYYKRSYKMRDTTGVEGYFGFHGTSGGLFGCPPVVFVLEKEGYKKRTVVIGNRKEKIVKLTPVEQRDHK